MNIQDWTYIAEGGAHAIFAYEPQPKQNQDECDASTNIIDNGYEYYHNKVLRIKKKDMINTIQYCHQCKNIYENNHDVSNQKENIITKKEGILKRHDRFQYPFISHVLREYIDDPVYINLSFNFIHSLYIKTIEGNRIKCNIPISRYKDWCIEGLEMDTLEKIKCHHCFTTSTIQVSLYPNYRRHCHYQQHYLSKRNMHNVLSIEIKPKAGYIPYSPLIQPQNIVKVFHSRYEILQQLHCRNIIDKGWSSSCKVGGMQQRNQSTYNPLDLFSQEMENKTRAIKALFECPQNNLKVVYNQTLLYGHNINHIEQKNLYLEVLHGLFRQHQITCDGDIGHILQMKIEELVTNILHHHSISLMNIVQTLQRKFDCLDVDGATVVYKRLVELCNGSLDEADELIDSDVLLFSKNVEEAEKLLRIEGLRDVNFYLSSCSDQVSSYLNLCQDFDELFLQRVRKLDPCHDTLILHEFNTWHDRANEIVAKFDRNDCVGLLQNWLLSLMMCDLSFIITLSYSTETIKHIESNQCNHPYKFYTSPTTNTYHVLTSEGCTFQYDIKIIDIDGKPARKLGNREKIEQYVQKFRSSRFIRS